MGLFHPLTILQVERVENKTGAPQHHHAVLTLEMCRNSILV